MKRAALIVAILVAAACGAKRVPTTPPPAVQIIGVTVTAKSGDGAAASPFFDGREVRVRLARGETIALQILLTTPQPVTFIAGQSGITHRLWLLEAANVTAASTSMYGPGRGTGRYGDRLVPTNATTVGTQYVLELEANHNAVAGPRKAQLALGTSSVPIVFTVDATTLVERSAAPSVWAYYDPRELSSAIGDVAASALWQAERACAAMFRRHGVLATPELTLDNAEQRIPLMSGARYLPVLLPDDRDDVQATVRRWIELTKGTGQLPFAIPIDEPRTDEARAKVRELASWVRAGGGGPSSFLYAVTAAPHPALGDQIDMYLSPKAVRRGEPHGGPGPHLMTYNGRSPEAGSMVVDSLPGSMRSWGWIAYRWDVPLWYVWDALYWHDRHNLKLKKPMLLSTPPLASSTQTAITFNDGDDYGNLDGVLAYPGDVTTGCVPSLRLLQLRRGLDDRALLDKLAACKGPDAAEAIAARIVPTALADASGNGAPPPWPVDDAVWEAARIELLDALAPCSAVDN